MPCIRDIEQLTLLRTLDANTNKRIRNGLRVFVFALQPHHQSVRKGSGWMRHGMERGLREKKPFLKSRVAVILGTLESSCLIWKSETDGSHHQIQRESSPPDELTFGGCRACSLEAIRHDLFCRIGLISSNTHNAETWYQLVARQTPNQMPTHMKIYVDTFNACRKWYIRCIAGKITQSGQWYQKQKNKKKKKPPSFAINFRISDTNTSHIMQGIEQDYTLDAAEWVVSLACFVLLRLLCSHRVNTSLPLLDADTLLIWLLRTE